MLTQLHERKTVFIYTHTHTNICIYNPYIDKYKPAFVKRKYTSSAVVHQFNDLILFGQWGVLLTT